MHALNAVIVLFGFYFIQNAVHLLAKSRANLATDTRTVCAAMKELCNDVVLLPSCQTVVPMKRGEVRGREVMIDWKSPEIGRRTM